MNKRPYNLCKQGTRLQTTLNLHKSDIVVSDNYMLTRNVKEEKKLLTPEFVGRRLRLLGPSL